MNKIKDAQIVVFDTETTGLSADSYIVEIGAVKLEGERIISTFSTLVRPPFNIPAEAYRVHGISDSMVKDAPSFVMVVDKFLEFIEGAILVAHNAEFDLKVLSVNLKRVKKSLPGNPVLDTYKASKNLFTSLPSHSLSFLVEYWGIPYRKEELHRALSDAKYTACVFLRMLEKCGFSMDDPVDKLMEFFGPPVYFKDFDIDIEENDTLVEAINSALPIEFTYPNSEGELVKRRVIPISIINRYNKKYLKAYCIVDEKDKLFRLDKMADLKILSDLGSRVKWSLEHR